MTVNAASRWDAADYARNAAFVPALGAPVLALLDPRPGERILDLGCGDGVLTERIAAAGATVVGVDASPGMIVAARARGLDARVADGQALAFRDEFDAVFSNAALHWMLDGAAVAAGVFRALSMRWACPMPSRPPSPRRSNAASSPNSGSPTAVGLPITSASASP